MCRRALFDYNHLQMISAKETTRVIIKQHGLIFKITLLSYFNLINEITHLNVS